eukprot:1334399-Rhodomonas_salina.1
MPAGREWVKVRARSTMGLGLCIRGRCKGCFVEAGSEGLGGRRLKGKKPKFATASLAKVARVGA